MLCFAAVICYLVGTTCSTCSRDETVEAAKVSEQLDDSAINTDDWSDGETATIRCKNYTKAYTWTNTIRSISGVSISTIDSYNSSVDSSQLGYIVVVCNGSSFEPDIFTGQDTWCALGCTPIPTDTTHYWSAEYPPGSVTTEKDAAPINVDPSSYVTVGCRDGYTRKNNDNGASVSRCDEVGWIEPLSSYPECVPGCPDLTTTINNRVALNTKRTDTDAPFITGDTIEFYCQDPYSMLGNSTITCSSLNVWDRDTPVCVSAAQGTLLGSAVTLLLLLALAMAWS